MLQGSLKRDYSLGVRTLDTERMIDMLYIIVALCMIGTGTVIWGSYKAVASAKVFRERREQRERAARWRKRFRELGYI